jgi:hypothetical protein
MRAATKPSTEKGTKQLRQLQKDWLDDIHKRSGDSFAQMADACNVLAERTGQKSISKETLRHFYNNYQDASKGANRLLSDRVAFMLYKVYGIEPSFAPHLLYDMDKDDAEITPYVKHCKQYLSEVAMAKGIYRTDVARAVGLADSILSRLFNNKLPRGLQMKTLEAIREQFGVNFSPRFRAFLETESDSEHLPIIGSISLRGNDDRVWLHAKSDQKRLAIALPFLSSKLARAIELEGPTINPLMRGGMLLVYQESGKGVSAACIEQTCVVQTEDDNWHVKIVKRSNKPKLYRLESMLSAEIEERELKCAYKIELTLMPGL